MNRARARAALRSLLAVSRWTRHFTVILWRAHGASNRARVAELIARTLWARFGLARASRPFAIELDGVRFHIDASSQDISAYASVFIAGEYEPDPRFEIQPGATVVDVGAQIGFFTVRAASKAGPSGRIIALEPDPGSFGRLERNVAVNKLANVTILQCAAAAHADGVYFESRPHSVESHIVATPRAGSIRVASCTLDGLVMEHDLRRIDYLKIDTEGAELQILRAASNTLPRARVAAIEIHSQHWIREIDDMLARAGLTKIGSHSLLHYYART
jgi:FkbM family methyltransferase